MVKATGEYQVRAVNAGAIRFRRVCFTVNVRPARAVSIEATRPPPARANDLAARWEEFAEYH